MTVAALKKIIPWQELKVINRSKELGMVVKAMANRIDHIPALYETDGNNNAVCQLHYFDTQSSMDWYIFETDMDTGKAFGFGTYTGEFDDPYAEYGYIDLFDLCKSARINLDLYFGGITKAEIERRKYGKTT